MSLNESKGRRATVLSAGIIPVRRPVRGPVCQGTRWLCLILRAYAYWDFPKGLVEKDEDPYHAAVRELREETGITNAEPRWNRDYFETAPYARGKIARYYLAEVTGDRVLIRPNRRGIVEHHEFRWLPFDEARTLLVPRVQEALDWARRRIS